MPTLLRSIPACLSEAQLVQLAARLGAGEVGGPLSAAEQALLIRARELPSLSAVEETIRTAIFAGEDPLGTALCQARTVLERRRIGAYYTPAALVQPMVDWVLAQHPDRVVDPGCGSGRFSAAIVRRNPRLPVVAIDTDPVATLLTRAVLAVLGARAATVLHADYTAIEPPGHNGRTAFIGNPPYVRHHELPPAAKTWAVQTGRRLGVRVSGLAGLHAYFFLATACYARHGDVGCFVTSAEWLDVNYGAVIRELLLGRLGGQAIHVIEPEAVPFEDAMTTAAISCFTVGATPAVVRLQLVSDPCALGALADGHSVPREVLAGTQRWTPILRMADEGDRNRDEVPLGAIARVHRGVATGANDFFVLTRERARELGIERWCRPVITSAEEVFRADGVVRDGPERRLLLDVPADVNRKAHPELDAYLQLGERPEQDKPAVCDRYLPSHRRPWWHLGRTSPPPIVATYMARQAPVFALNPDGLAIVNIAHGIHPRVMLSPEQLRRLVQALNGARASFRGNGRTYHGGLEKFEPREMENLTIPPVVTGLL